MKRKPTRTKSDVAALNAMVEDATVDSNDESDQVMGLFNMLVEDGDMPSGARLQRGRRSESTEISAPHSRHEESRNGFKGAVDQSRRRYPTHHARNISRCRRFKAAVDQSRRRFPVAQYSLWCVSYCFKGAVDQSRRRYRRGRRAPEPLRAASKGPSIRVDGDARDRDHESRLTVALQRGVDGDALAQLFGCVRVVWLQRGRRSESTEID